jgi:hypothetical protein
MMHYIVRYTQVIRRLFSWVSRRSTPALAVAEVDEMPARRQDKAFRESLRKLIEENRDILERLAR